jgi:hypothetical protein
VERMNQFFVTRSLHQNEFDFDIPVRFQITVDSKTFLMFLWL